MAIALLVCRACTAACLATDLEWIAGVDLEFTDGYLRQTQAGGFGSFPAGRQYDFRCGCSTNITLCAVQVSVHRKGSAQSEVCAMSFWNTIMTTR